MTLIKSVVCFFRGHDYQDVVDNFPFKLHSGVDDEMDPDLYIFRAICQRCGHDTSIVGPGPIWQVPWNRKQKTHWADIEYHQWRALNIDDTVLMIRRIRTLEFGHPDSQYDSQIQPPTSE